MRIGPARALWSGMLRNRHRLPLAADRALESAKWRLRRPPPDLALAPAPNGEPPRVLIGPANFAGQGRAWAAALERAGAGAAVNWAFGARRAFAYPADYEAPVTVNAAPAAFQSAQFQRVVEAFQAAVLESGRPLFGRLFRHAPDREALALAAAGLALAVLWHGSDVRLPSRHRASHPLSPYALPELRRRALELESTAVRNRRAMGALGLPQLVSTPDLLDQVDGAEWCPVVVAALPVPLPPPPFQRPVPRVVHIPSDPLVKGTDLIDGPLRRLAQAGRVEYIRAEGLPAAQVRDLYAGADIVADQFRMGIYGVAAAEAMAAGRLVVSDVDPSVQRAVESRTGLALPIRRVAAADLAAFIEDTAANPEPARALAARGPAFVEAVHSGAASAKVLARALGLVGTSGVAPQMDGPAGNLG
ncbi:MAG: hypothetical protein LBL01_07585 [Bifidobacteriaceae bacterium]|jgi:hypothetical protein|nr:hypothetical protein [Bifidobacteriaceae bacterium]